MTGPDENDLTASDELERWLADRGNEPLTARAEQMREARSTLRADTPADADVDRLIASTLANSTPHSGSSGSRPNSASRPHSDSRQRRWIPAAAAVVVLAVGIAAAGMVARTGEESADNASSASLEAESPVDGESGTVEADSDADNFSGGDEIQGRSDEDSSGALAEEDAAQPPSASSTTGPSPAESVAPGETNDQDAARAAVSAFAGVRTVIVLRLP